MKYNDKEINTIIDSFLQEKLSLLLGKEINYDYKNYIDEIVNVPVTLIFNLIHDIMILVKTLKDFNYEK